MTNYSPKGLKADFILSVAVNSQVLGGPVATCSWTLQRGHDRGEPLTNYSPKADFILSFAVTSQVLGGPVATCS